MQVGVIGLGAMGRRMATRLIDAGNDVVVYNRSPEPAAAFASRATVAAEPAAVAAASEVILISVSATNDVRDVVFGRSGVAEAMNHGTVIVDTSSISPMATRDFASEVAGRGASWLDAPVSGGPIGAERGTLTILVGGETEALAKARPVLELIGSRITHMGQSGSGQAAKAVNQVLLASLYVGLSEGLVLAEASGLDPTALVDALSQGTAASWALSHRSPQIIERSHTPGFRLALHRKDLQIALELGRSVGVALPVTALVEQLESGLIARGHGDDDITALSHAIRNISREIGPTQ